MIKECGTCCHYMLFEILDDDTELFECEFHGKPVEYTDEACDHYEACDD